MCESAQQREMGTSLSTSLMDSGDAQCPTNATRQVPEDTVLGVGIALPFILLVYSGVAGAAVLTARNDEDSTDSEIGDRAFLMMFMTSLSAALDALGDLILDVEFLRVNIAQTDLLIIMVLQLTSKVCKPCNLILAIVVDFVGTVYAISLDLTLGGDLLFGFLVFKVVLEVLTGLFLIFIELKEDTDWKAEDRLAYQGGARVVGSFITSFIAPIFLQNHFVNGYTVMVVWFVSTFITAGIIPLFILVPMLMAYYQQQVLELYFCLDPMSMILLQSEITYLGIILVCAVCIVGIGYAEREK